VHAPLTNGFRHLYLTQDVFGALKRCLQARPILNSSSVMKMPTRVMMASLDHDGSVLAVVVSVVPGAVI
jgi:uncharacterized membrane protein